MTRQKKTTREKWLTPQLPPPPLKQAAYALDHPVNPSLHDSVNKSMVSLNCLLLLHCLKVECLIFITIICVL